jgi:hypothetical protein
MHAFVMQQIVFGFLSPVKYIDGIGNTQENVRALLTNVSPQGPRGD